MRLTHHTVNIIISLIAIRYFNNVPQIYYVMSPTSTNKLWHKHKADAQKPSFIHNLFGMDCRQHNGDCFSLLKIKFYVTASVTSCISFTIVFCQS